MVSTIALPGSKEERSFLCMRLKFVHFQLQREVHVVDQAGREVRRQAGSSVREVLEERRLRRQGLDGGPQEVPQPRDERVHGRGPAD